MSKPVPAITIRISFEAATAEIVLENIDTPGDAERLGSWISGDARRLSIVRLALELVAPRAGDLDDEFGLLETLAASLEPVRNTAPDPYEAKCPMGSYQRRSLRRVVAAGEPGRTWIRWALQQEWLLDPSFERALRHVAAREGIT